MKVLKTLQNIVRNFISHKKISLLQESTHSSNFLTESTNTTHNSKYEQLTEIDKKRVNVYLEELMEGLPNDLNENPINRLIDFENNSAEKSKDLLDLILSIMMRIDANSKSILFSDATEKIRESVELKILMEILEIYDKRLQDIEKETELVLVALTEFKIRFSSHLSNSLNNIDEERIQQFKSIINHAMERIEICKLIQLDIKNTVDKEKIDCNINAISRKISIVTQGLDFQELEMEVLNQLFKEIQEKQHTLMGTIMDQPLEEISPKYLAQCYFKLERNKEQIINNLKKEIQNLNIQVEKVKATQESLYHARQKQIQQGIFEKSPNENKDYYFKLKNELMPRLKELEDKYKALGIFETSELKILLYEVKFKILTLTSKSYFQSYLTLLQRDNEKDKSELEIYKQIILRKAKMICDGQNSNINRWFGKENSKDIINLIGNKVKDKKGNIDINKILESEDLLSLILAFDSEYGIEMLEIPLSQMENVSQIDKGLILDSNITISSIFELYSIEKDFLERHGLTLNNFIDLNNILMQMYHQYFMHSGKKSFHGVNNGILYLPEGINKITEDSNLSKLLSERCIERMVCPSTLYSIEKYAIMSHFLRRIIFNEGLIYIGDYAISECDNLIQFNSPTTLKRIGEGAFYGCKNLKMISLNDGLKAIGKNAFEDCCLVEVLMPSTVTNLGRNIFDGCNLKKVTCSEKQKTILQSQCNPNIEIVIGLNNTNPLLLE